MLLGLLSGYVGGWIDETLMRLVDAVQGFPAILSALLFTAVFSPGIVVSMIAIGIAFVPAFARLTRGSVLELREREFVVAARALGARRRAPGRCATSCPNALPPLIVQATTSFPVAILAEAALAYLGLGHAAAASVVGTDAAGGAELPVVQPVVRGASRAAPSPSRCSA